MVKNHHAGRGQLSMDNPRRLYRKKVPLDGAIIAPPWFSGTGYPVRTGNAVHPMVDGQETFREIYRALENAKETIHIATWWLEPGFPIRRESTGWLSLGRLLERKGMQGVHVRLLLWDAFFKDPARLFFMLSEGLSGQWADSADYGYDIRWLERASDGKLEGITVVSVPYEPAPGDEEWEKILFSHHQKTTVIDSRLGFCSGMNWRRVDWDTPEHGHRERKRQKGPRHDLCAKVEGPVVMDLEHNFRERWNEHAAPSQRIQEDIPWVAPVLEPGGNRVAQVTRTRRKTGQASILEMYSNAIANAQEYIYIENQYFRSAEIASAIARRMEVRPKLHVFVVTMEDDGLFSPSAPYTYDALRILEQAHEKAGYGEFRAYCLYTHNPDPWWARLYQRLAGGKPLERYHPINLHAKVMIVDDQFFTIGSANINLRSMKYDTEINVGVLDPEGAKMLRLRLWREHLDLGPDEQAPEDDDVERWAALWQARAEYNEKAVMDNRPLKGNVRFIENVKPKAYEEKKKVTHERWVFLDEDATRGG